MKNTEKRTALMTAEVIVNMVLADCGANTRPGSDLIIVVDKLYAALDAIPRRDAPDETNQPDRYKLAVDRARMEDGSLCTSRFIAECERIDKEKI